MRRHQATIESLESDGFMASFEQASHLILETLKKGRKILIAGNGGSSADAQHFAAEFVCKYKEDRSPLPCVALTTDSSILTSISNDYHFNDVFSRQVLALGQEEDTLIALSTSGNSRNILNAIEAAKSKKTNVIGLTGRSGGEMKGRCLLLQVDSDETARIQEGHMMILHTFCEIIDTVSWRPIV